MGGFLWELSASLDSETSPGSASNSSPEIDNNSLFGKYELGKLLGYGAFGKVYHAREVGTGRSVAVKAVSKRKVVRGGFVGHVKREISIMRRLRHPSVVELLEVLATRSKIYFVMEFAKGGELFARLAKGRFTEDLSRRYFQQLITAVGYCHARGVFHRDLKPENLLLDENLALKVTDFGLSAVRDQVRPDGLLHTQCGTPAYVAPEILAKKGYDGAKVDIWSCGVILYVLVAGYLPFNDTNLMAMYRKIYLGQFRCPKWTSPDLKRLLSRILDTNPDTRITVEEILRDPWFAKGYEEVRVNSGGLEFDRKGPEKCLNAFDIISLSPGFDLSGLFDESDNSGRVERFLSTEPAEKIIFRVEEVAKAEAITVEKKKNWGVKLDGWNGNFTVVIEIYRLTEELVMVEMQEANGGQGKEIWKDKVRPQLDSLICEPLTKVSGN